MQNKWVINVLLIIIMILVVFACVVAYLCFTNDVEIIEQSKEEVLFTTEKFPKLESSIAALPLAEEFKAYFTGIDISEIQVEHSKTDNVCRNLINRNADLILVTELPEEERKLAKYRDIELEIVPIAKEAFVFLVNKNNPVENLTLSQIQNIYSGEITKWKDVGGTDSKITAFQRPEGSESHKAMLKYVMQGIKMMKPITETVSQGKEEIIDVVSDYDNSETAIVYSYYNYATTMYSTENIKMLSVNGIKPTYENIQNGLYGIQSTYYAVIRKDEPEDSDTRKLLNAMVSERGQNVAKEAGYVQNY